MSCIIPAPIQKAKDLRPPLFPRVCIKNHKIPGLSQFFQGYCDLEGFPGCLGTLNKHEILTEAANEL